MDEIEQYRSFFEEGITSEFNTLESQCNHHWCPIDGSYVCVQCGDVDRRIIFYEHQPSFYRGPCHVYKRNLYFRDKISALSGHRQESSPKYLQMLEDLKSKPFETIRELKNLLKKGNFSCFNKHLYSIYFDLKGKRLINLSSYDIENLENQFFSFERNFKRLYPNNKYILNYNIIIFCLLKKNGFPCANHILLSKNRNHSMTKFLEIIENIENY